MSKKPTSKSARWQAALEQAREKVQALDAAMSELETAFQDLKDIQSEYGDWRDSFPENMQSSATYEKLDAICELDLEPEFDVSPFTDILDEAEGAELPMGFGKD